MSEAKREGRDPRRDPRPGDVLEKLAHGGRRKIWRRVIGKGPGALGYDVFYAAEDGARSCWITTWQEWSKGAEVVKIGGEG